MGLTEGTFVFLRTGIKDPKYLLGMVVEGEEFKPIKVDIGISETTDETGRAVSTILECIIPCDKHMADVFTRGIDHFFTSYKKATEAMRLSATPTWGRKLKESGL